MNLIEKIGRSWQLLRSSLVVIWQNPKLMLFPFATGVFVLAIALFFLAPIVLLPTGYHFYQGEHWQALANKLLTMKPINGSQNSVNAAPQTWLTAYGIVIYMVSMFLATFCNVAFSSQIIAALNGHSVSVRAGVAVAMSRIKSILVWSLFAGLVGLLIRQIEERLSIIGRLISGLIGLAWSVASVFVIPVLIREQPTVNPIKVLGKSASTIRKTWGEALTGYVGLQGANSLVFAMSITWLALGGVLAFAFKNGWIMLPVGVAWVLALLVYSYIANIASQVYLCALYIYASEGVVPTPYSRETLDLAWKVKKG